MAQATNPEAFRQARKAAGLSITETNRAALVSRTTIYRLESERSPRPSLHVVQVLAKTYGVTPESLLVQS